MWEVADQSSEWIWEWQARIPRDTPIDSIFLVKKTYSPTEKTLRFVRNLIYHYNDEGRNQEYRHINMIETPDYANPEFLEAVITKCHPLTIVRMR